MLMNALVAPAVWDGYLGIDVAKDKLDVVLHRQGHKSHRLFLNTPAGFGQLHAWMGSWPSSPVLVCLEATGSYSDGIADFLVEHGYATALLNPAVLVNYRKSQNIRSKTDKLDAELLARYAQQHQPRLWTPLPQPVQSLRRLLEYRRDVLRMRQQESNRLHAGRLTDWTRLQVQQHREHLQLALKEADKQIKTYLKSQTELCALWERLQSIPGIGWLTAALLIALIGDITRFDRVGALVSLAGLPKLWNIPYARNSFFLGRDELLERLHAQLQSGQTTALAQSPQAVSGLGGIGKTQLAIEYAYRYHQDYQAVLWARAATSEDLIASYSALSTLLNLPEQQASDQELTIAAVKAWLQKNSKWLLILDNADDLELLPPFLPSVPGGHILLTTRAWDMQGFAGKLTVEALPDEQGALLLLRRAGLLTAADDLAQAPTDERRRRRPAAPLRPPGPRRHLRSHSHLGCRTPRRPARPRSRRCLPLLPGHRSPAHLFFADPRSPRAHALRPSLSTGRPARYLAQRSSAPMETARRPGRFRRLPKGK
jgi:transposase